MDNMKITAKQYDRLTPSQSGSRERDEGFVASQVDATKAKHDMVASKTDNTRANNSQDVSEDHSKRLIEQRKRDLAQQLSEKDQARDQMQQNEELSAQRKLESRAAANREKIKDSYDAVKQSDNEVIRAEKMVAEESKANNTDKYTDPINLVV